MTIAIEREDGLDVGSTTLDEYLARAEQRYRSNAEASARDEASCVRALASACSKIGRFVRRAGLNDVKAFVEGKNGTVNVHGEEQAALDEAAHDACVHELLKVGACAWIASEESEEIIAADPKGRIAVVFDPLDGSSNIECGVGVGTIFGLVSADAKSNVESVYRRRGGDMTSVGYVMYGASTVLVLSFMAGDAIGGVCAFTFDDDLGTFVLTKANIRVPESGAVYSVNQANYLKWDASTRAYVDECAAQKKSLRYIGSMVADVHRTLLYGGTFHYPADVNNPQGKLRSLYECFPLAAVIERAGGAAISGANARVLDHVPSSAHARMPIHVGSSLDIARLARIFAENGDAGEAPKKLSPR